MSPLVYLWAVSDWWPVVLICLAVLWSWGLLAILDPRETSGARSGPFPSARGHLSDDDKYTPSNGGREVRRIGRHRSRGGRR